VKTLHLSIIAVLVLGIGTAYAYSSAGIPETHYPPTNDTKLELLVMNSTEFKERTTGYNYTLAGIDNNWIPKASNYYDFGGARVTFMVWGFDNGTVKGVAFNLDPQLKIKSIFEYNGDNPPAGYYTDRCSGCFLGVFNSTKQLVEPKNVLESPLKQFKSGIAANDVKCKQDLQLIIKAEDETPTCVKLQTAQKLVERGWGWAMQTIDSLKPLLPNRIIGLENDTGIVTLGNQTYYFETPNYTNTAYYNPVQISFHEMIFTLFPPGFRGGLPTGVGCEGTTTGIITGSGSYYWTDAKFPDGIHELLHIFAYSKLSCPVHSIPTYFSNHTNPQAGLTFYDGKMKLLVNTNNQAVPQLKKIPVIINGANSDFSLNYTITGGQIEQAKADISNKALILSMKTTGSGTLIADLPRALIDPKANGQDSQFIILEDGKQVEYKQIKTTDTSRVLSIQFTFGVSQIEIIAPEPIR